LRVVANIYQTHMTASKKEMHSSYADFSDDTEPASVTEEVAVTLSELLTTKQIPLGSSFALQTLSNV
jgi:hypothetical protein